MWEPETPHDLVPAVDVGRVPQLGDEVRYGDKFATIFKVHQPVGPDALVDLTVDSGRVPEVHLRVSHTVAGGWLWASEVPPPPPPEPTLDQKIAFAREAGIKVPSVGDIVLRVILNQGVSDVNAPATLSRRAVVRAVSNVVGNQIILDLGVFANDEAPLDVSAPDAVAFEETAIHGPVLSNVRAEGWAWPGCYESPKYVPPSELYGQVSCPRCGGRVHFKKLIRLFGEHVLPGRRIFQVCEACAFAVLDWATTPPAEPAIVTNVPSEG